jgi:hypothetical protein
VLSYGHVKVRLRAGRHLLPPLVALLPIKYVFEQNRADNVIRVLEFVESRPPYLRWHMTVFKELQQANFHAIFTSARRKPPHLHASVVAMKDDFMFDLTTAMSLYSYNPGGRHHGGRIVCIHFRTSHAYAHALKRYVGGLCGTFYDRFYEGCEAYLVIGPRDLQFVSIEKILKDAMQAVGKRNLHCRFVNVMDLPLNGYMRFVPYVDPDTYMRMYCTMTAIKDAWMTACAE